ncbi:lasso peptide biosynthesis PqqD family chaperone [Frankia sp. AgB1.9]|uniref:lasso peptide biosynthesis PqqD family chaperone n=1 Tax=unclassified Frankia TaxID=2632575 RepID=UPI001932122C|nr:MULTISPECIES: lasso peptide biosynthesis PqqD family chaperone [unclassified Frankia]MBL7490376.1 lasso peptide biosynthesis PqqD family chaperone [Frankia sp. AgW1.1]MBL7552813.1 lasso peptide biosynthesis PqqD family chaperone [Frankia sp. AgB1.9]MBL7619659.1 lasso peptide biosynthesis PqqD family chaperone [Frankia sp. AgB1.8]
MLTLNRSVVSTETDYGTALLDERSGRYWTLNPTAALALRVLLDGGDPPQAARALLDQYDVAPATARADVDKLVDDLQSAGLIIGSVSGSGIEPPAGTPSPASGGSAAGASAAGGSAAGSQHRSGTRARHALRSALGRSSRPRTSDR